MYKQRHNKRGGFRGRNTRPFKARNSGGGRRIRTFDPRSVIGKDTSSSYDNDVEYEIKHQFSDFEINEQLSRNILSRGFSAPTPIQDQAIPEILSGRDVVGVANTGTGKTAAFLIPLINKVLKNGYSRVLVVAPTRELAVQIDRELRLFSDNLKIYSTICIGGVPIGRQIPKLRKRPQFVIGTPGRLLDLENQNQLNFHDFESIVLDEVDRMLDMGFVRDVEKIIFSLPKVRQSLFFSATLDPKVLGVMNKFIHDPVMISVKTADASTNVFQKAIELNGREKADLLREILDSKEASKSLVFTRTKRGADRLYRKLISVGFQTAVLHGNKTQNQRQRSLQEFKTGKINVLIATDVASRGIDVKDISHVINFDLPESYDNYIHRIGRTGRAGKKGMALTFIG